MEHFLPTEIVERILDEKALLEFKDNITNVNQEFLQLYQHDYLPTFTQLGYIGFRPSISGGTNIQMIFDDFYEFWEIWICDSDSDSSDSD